MQGGTHRRVRGGNANDNDDKLGGGEVNKERHLS